MTFLIVISSNDPETVWNAYRVGSTALTHDHEVTIFLLGSGVEAPLLSTIKYDIREQIEVFRASGGKTIGCGLCCESRKDLMPQLEQELSCVMGSMQQLYTLIAESDKVLTF
jgi:uncharacterized protein involved in oxidation of intracellular sulfur